ncbi:inactive TPR repeat-containing thioredoxin TTL3-like [Cucurbita pepo subsp. pepo]|uniref:inactive TPR repeat-containing thioredoxin TTL3-like n=1 Tax=Cucurbita pepo subsp. pepo TaxID=3664 RepID=UPI000C9D58E0|nr:inactive TPR repeat-containing thioredoxin TTL3-like [Cucurbita pepo subsp. pepo]
MGSDSLTGRFRDGFSLGDNKPDVKEHDLGSPVSPLMTTRSLVTGDNGYGIGGANTSSSSSGSSGSVTGRTNNTQMGKRSEGKPDSHSGELSVSSETSPSGFDGQRSAAALRSSRPGHRRSLSTGSPLIYSGKTLTTTSNGINSVSSNSISNVFPSGNICPSGKVLKANIAHRTPTRTDTLGSGTGNYGHGSIIRGGGGAKLGNPGSLAEGNLLMGGETSIVKRAMAISDPEEVKRAANELYRRGNFVEALSLYDRAISLFPENAACRSNRAAALTALGRLGEAVRECEEAVRLDLSYGRAHQRLAALYLRFGQVEKSRSHLLLSGQPDHLELQKLKLFDKILNQCADARKAGDWRSVLKEAEAAITAGADFSPQLVSCKAEALLKLHQLEEADSCLSNVSKMESLASCSQTKFFGMLAEAYVFFVRAMIEMALGRFDNAVQAAERASKINMTNLEVSKLLSNVKMVARARSRGFDLFSSGRYTEACTAYGEGLKYDSSNHVLYCNRAVCWAKIGLWEQSVEDCNQALKIQPNYTKALLRRAASNAKLERWEGAVKDLEFLRRELPGDGEVAESLHQAQAALKRSRGEVVDRRTDSGEVEEVFTLDKLKAAISSSSVSVVHFKVSNDICDETSAFVNTLCIRYPSVKFIKVDVEESMSIAKAEGIKTVPAFKIYKNGEKLIETIRPIHRFLEDSVRSCIVQQTLPALCHDGKKLI